ncbi:cell envelope integrity protein TolA [Microvirga terrestris]|uniref:Cell envelope integrity protein TolA n=1 Tax=Microvirga terrestris TaxID=2791024 RepID=A0ABS0HX77_9HYPH|nr:cell envelope integrity protein TolA [Microvirga terrestris]MBF9198111.1 cell envelope integrity protein TolA [Microvirga terrestris]
MNRLISAPVLVLLAAGLSGCVTAGNPRADLIPIFIDQFMKCYAVPQQALSSEAPVVEIRLNLDGSLAQEPRVVRGDPASVNAQAALKAVKRCAPFHIPASITHRYAQWKVMQVTFDP